MKKILLLVGLLISSNFIIAQISVDESLSIEVLIEDVLIGNPNFPSSNYSKSTGSDFGDDNGIGAFNVNGTDFPFSGIVLSSGRAMNAEGPNTDLNSDGGSAWPGDADLEAVTGVSNTNNASSIEFDFVPAVSAISLEFLMASEEYDQNFECTFGDTFAFILTNNNTGTSENLAIIPGTTTSIQVVTVHLEVAGQCDAVNEEFFDTYNFEPFGSSTDTAIDFNGQTVPFLIVGDLVEGNSYTLKIVVADALDTAFDVALFVKGGSFGAFPVIEEDPDDLLVVDSDGDGIATFDLTVNETQMLGAIDTSVYSFDFSYYLTEEDAVAGVNSIFLPETFTNTSNPQTIYVRMQNSFTGAHVETSFQIETDGQLGLEDGFGSYFSLYPNPVLDQLHINSSELFSELNVAIYDVRGELLISEKQFNTTEEINIDLSSLSSGIYFLELISEEHNTTIKLIKN